MHVKYLRSMHTVHYVDIICVISLSDNCYILMSLHTYIRSIYYNNETVCLLLI